MSLVLVGCFGVFIVFSFGFCLFLRDQVRTFKTSECFEREIPHPAVILPYLPRKTENKAVATSVNVCYLWIELEEF